MEEWVTRDMRIAWAVQPLQVKDIPSRFEDDGRRFMRMLVESPSK
jgi:hypothetical protein